MLKKFDTNRPKGYGNTVASIQRLLDCRNFKKSLYNLRTERTRNIPCDEEVERDSEGKEKTMVPVESFGSFL
jgi:hypothetical protein